MDVVYSRVLEMRGTLNLRSDPAKGLTVELRLPAALISTHALLVRTRGDTLALASHGIEDIHYVTPDQVQTIGENKAYRAGDNLYRIASLETLLGLPQDRRGGSPVLLLRLDSGAIHAVRVADVTDSRDLVVKNLGRYVPKISGVVGATILGDGSVAPVIDLPELMRAPVPLPSGVHADELEAMRGAYERATLTHHASLVVDDSLSARRATAQFMKDAGFEVSTAIDGLEAVAILDKWLPDILLVDMEMPRMNGLELAAHVRATKGAEHLPIVTITSRSTDKHRRQAEAAGVNVYLTKPFSDEALLGHVMELTAMRHG